MVEMYCPQLADERVLTQYTPFDDGAGIQLGLAAGGEALHMDGALLTCPYYPPESLIKAILVNRDGRRFVAEDSYHSRTSINIARQPGGIAYLIADDRCFGRPEWGGYDVIDVWPDVASMEHGLGLPAGSLVETVRRYNAHAARGEDPDFHKGAKWLAPLDTAPFAALQASFGPNRFVGFTLGGLRVSSDGEVLQPDRRAIPGLYAAGACASNLAQDGTGYASGTCLGESTFFGRRAGRHAAGARA
jgi:succinate dehydrogenase/fumarate reductase flavoprotein subunit